MDKDLQQRLQVLQERERALDSRAGTLEHREKALNARERKLLDMMEEVKAYRKRLEALTKALQRSPQVAEQTARFWRLIAPLDVRGKKFARLGRKRDGGYVMLDDFHPAQVAYSFGINDDVSWDLDITRRGIPVYMYDPTIQALPEENGLMHFTPQGLSGRDGENNCFTLETLLRRNGHERHDNIILKMDVEGAEWASLAAAPDALIRRFAQIALELHGLHGLGQSGEQSAMMLDVLEKLRRWHEPVHLHANNDQPTLYLGGHPVPDCLEITYVRKSDHVFSPCSRTFPTDLDAPNIPDFAETMISRHLCGHCHQL